MLAGCAFLVCPPLFEMSTQLYNHWRIVAENSVKYVPPDGFLAFRFYNIQFLPGLCPGPRWGRCSPNSLFSRLPDALASTLGAFGSPTFQMLPPPVTDTTLPYMIVSVIGEQVNVYYLPLYKNCMVLFQ